MNGGVVGDQLPVLVSRLPAASRLARVAVETEMAKNVFQNSSKKLTGELASRSRNRKRARTAAVDLDAVVSASRRNDLLPELKLEKHPLSALHAPKRQVRDVNPEHVAEVAKSIATFGVSRPPVVAADGEIIDGVVIVEACRHLGLQQVPCIVADHLSPSEIRLLRLALNRLGEQGTWNLEALKLEFEELIEIEAPLDACGFAAPEIDLVLLGDEPAIDDAANDCPEIDMNRPAITQLGDEWRLGRHRLVCGDACVLDCYGRLFAGGAPNARAVFTDPPYNIPIKGFVSGQAHHRDFIMGVGEMSDDGFVTFLADFLKAVSSHLADGGVLFVCMDHRHAEHVLRAARAAGLSVVTLVVWHKGIGGMGRLYRSAHELVFVLKKGDGPVLNNIGLGKHGRDRTNVWEYPGANRKGSSANEQLGVHATPKPVELVADALMDVTNRGGIVIDPFLGSGTTIIAAEKTGRIAFGLELDPHYCDVIIRRFEKFTGVEAVHVTTGLTFFAMATLRQAEADRAAAEASATPETATAGAVTTERVELPANSEATPSMPAVDPNV
jgi:DNA modification methylase